MPKRFFFQAGCLLVLLVCFTSFFTSCMQDISQNTPQYNLQNGSISFSMSSKSVQKVVNKYKPNASSRNAAITGTHISEDIKWEVIVTLICDGEPESKPLQESEDGDVLLATFTGLPVGSIASATVSLYVEGYLFAKGESDEITIAEGINTLKVMMTDELEDEGKGEKEDDRENDGIDDEGGKGKDEHVVEDTTVTGIGTIELRIIRFTVQQNTELSSSILYQNEGAMVFSLIDEGSKDLFEDIDWGNPENQNAIYIDYKVKYRSTDVSEFFETKFNKIYPNSSVKVINPGNYQVYVTVARGNGEYINKVGETEKLPEFEPVSGTFNYTVTPGIIINTEEYYDLGDGVTYDIYPDLEDLYNVYGGYNPFNTLAIGIETILRKVNSNEITLILRGETDLNYTDLTRSVLTVAYNMSFRTFEIDMSAVTTENTSEDAKVLGEYGTGAGGEVRAANDNDPENIKSLILPDDMTAIGKNAFWGSYTKTIKIGKAVKQICYAAFSSSQIENIEFSENSTLKIIEDFAFNQAGIERLEIPASVIAIGSRAFERMNGEVASTVIFADISGSWYAAENSEAQTKWQGWIDGTGDPATEGSLISTDPSESVEDYTERLINRSNNTETATYLFCVKD